jgi:NAD(P)-dependent dehydrogenase (short-subunit alcohol dehydrogenase family)
VAPDRERVALIIGASRGLGLALTGEFLNRGWRAIATVRGERRTALHELAERSDRLEIEHVDTLEPDQVASLRQRLAGRRLDLLFVSAGVANGIDETVTTATTEEFVRTMVTNALAPMRAVEALQDLVSPAGTIAVMSSGLGSVTNNTYGLWEVYRASKAALNTLMRSYAARHAGEARALLLVAPGWVRTEMGGSEATMSIDESIPRVVDMVERQAGKAGLQYLNYRGETLPW